MICVEGPVTRKVHICSHPLFVKGCIDACKLMQYTNTTNNYNNGQSQSSRHHRSHSIDGSSGNGNENENGNGTSRTNRRYSII